MKLAKKLGIRFPMELIDRATFIDSGLETIDVDTGFEVIEAAEDEVDSVSFYEVENRSQNY